MLPVINISSILSYRGTKAGDHLGNKWSLQKELKALTACSAVRPKYNIFFTTVTLEVLLSSGSLQLWISLFEGM